MIRNGRHILLFGLVLVGASVFADTSWIDREKIRAAYHYGRGDVEQRAKRLHQLGFNTVILKCGTEKAEPWLKAAKKYGLHAFPAFNFNVRADKHGFRPAVLDTGVVEAYACPLDTRFWGEYLGESLLERARLARRPDLELSGLWIDFELYSTRTSNRYYTRACYCDSCFSSFCEHRTLTVPAELTAAQRHPWLRERDLVEDYQRFLGVGMEALARALRDKVHAVAPDFLLGFYPSPHNWSLEAVARGLSSKRVPIIIWATQTYSGGGAKRVPDDWRDTFQAQGINARYCSGLLLRCYTARNLAANLYQTTRKSDGYWLFTTYTLNIPPERQKGDYYLGAGTADEYWREIGRGNAEIDRWLAEGDAFRSALKLVAEPVVLRALRQPELRRRLAGLKAPPALKETVDLPLVKLRGHNVLILGVEQGKPVRIPLGLTPINTDRGPIRWQAFDLEGRPLGDATGKLGEGVEIAFTPARTGIVIVQASARGACWFPLSTNVPLGLYAAKSLHLMSGAEALWVGGATGQGGGTITVKGGSGRETVRAQLFAHNGTKVADVQTDATNQPASLVVPARTANSAVFRLCLSKADIGILEDYMVTVNTPLPAALALLPEMAFSSSPPAE
ncbi:MAG: hypothetical protein KAI66_18715 [Lentisphaeria bacterium]|nr:hypothetical protein [Lentisphaeria bacterium]